MQQERASVNVVNTCVNTCQTSMFQAFSYITFANIQMAKASDMTNLRFREWKKRAFSRCGIDGKTCKILWLFLQGGIYHY